MWSIKGYFFRGDYLDPCGTINGYHLDETTASLREKYWGEIYSSSYHHYMALLQSRLNRTHSEQSLNGRKYIRNNWEKLLAYNHEYMGFAEGRIRDTTPHLKEKHLVYLQKFRFEVWAGGYNWLVDNELSGDRIKERIDQIMDLYEKTNEGYGKIILISHSMGGGSGSLHAEKI